MASRAVLRAKRAAVVFGAATALLIGVANGFVLVEGRSHSTPVGGPTTKPIAIVPGCTASPEGRPLVVLASRLRAALDLYEHGRVSSILISGAESATDPEVTAMSNWLTAHGVSKADVLVDAGGLRTRDTMERAATLFQIKSAIICTQTLNMPRSLFLARRAGIEAEGVSLPTPMTRSPRWLGTEALKNVLSFVESYLPSDRYGRSGSTIAQR